MVGLGRAPALGAANSTESSLHLGHFWDLELGLDELKACLLDWPQLSAHFGYLLVPCPGPHYFESSNSWTSFEFTEAENCPPTDDFLCLSRWPRSR